MLQATDYPWNIRVSLGGVSFTGPGMESEGEARSVASIVEETEEAVASVEVFEQR
jgi:hypothetical protein